MNDNGFSTQESIIFFVSMLIVSLCLFGIEKVHKPYFEKIRRWWSGTKRI